MDNDNTRPKPFTDSYPQWDAPTFDPSNHYLTPKNLNETTNRSVMSRLYETVLERFSAVRQRLLQERIDS